MTHTLAALGYDPRSFQFRRDPYPVYRRLQQEAPRFYDAEKRLWVLSRYDDVRFVLHDPRFQFSEPTQLRPADDPSFRVVHQAPTSLEQLALRRRKAIDLQNRFPEMRHPPEHTALRRLLQPWFSPSAMQRMHATLHDLAHALIDGILARQCSPFDLVQEFALPFTYGAICALLGIPRTQMHEMARHTRTVIAATDLHPSSATLERGLWATYAFAKHFHDLLQETHNLQPDGLAMHLLHEQRSGALHADDLLSLLTVLLFAGHDTSQHFLGLAVRTLWLHDAWKQLRSTPEHIPLAIEELIRFDGPIQARPHLALEDVELGEWQIRKGDRFHLLLGAANRDPQQFERPDALVFDRAPNPHLAYLHGIHYCAGAPLARAEIAVALRALLERMPDLRLTENGQFWLPTYFMRGFERLLVTNAAP